MFGAGSWLVGGGVVIGVTRLSAEGRSKLQGRSVPLSDQELLVSYSHSLVIFDKLYESTRIGVNNYYLLT